MSVTLDASIAYVLSALPVSPRRVTPIRRTPLVFPSCCSCPTPSSYDQGLPWSPPASRDFIRANAWSVPVPELPFLPGLSREHPERLLTYADYRYEPRLWPAMLEAHARRGYTHWVRSWPDARSYGGVSIGQFVEQCLRIKEVIPYVAVFLGSKDFDPHDQPAAEQIRRVEPILDALIAAKAADEVFPSWEHNLWNRGDQYNGTRATDTSDYFTYVGQRAHAAGLSCWVHFSTEYTCWCADGRYAFWDRLGANVDGLLYQGDPAWDIGQLQARLVDTLVQFARQGNRHKLRAFELVAMQQFTNDHPDEDEADAIGFLACCTRGPAGIYVWGSGNGARNRDGSPL